jgi:hypothetical protein
MRKKMTALKEVRVPLIVIKEGPVLNGKTEVCYTHM